MKLSSLNNKFALLKLFACFTWGELRAMSSQQKKFDYYTKKEVKDHQNRGDLWIAIHGKVYDVSKFLEDVRFYHHGFV